jgi:glycosyltransferase involved in cell wall biosynthesis
MNGEKSKIAVFSLAYAPFEGGAEIAAREVIKRLKGLNFTIFTYRFDGDWLEKEDSENAEIIRLGKGRKKKKRYGRILDKIRYIFLAWRKAEEMHARKRFDAIWAIMASYGGLAALLFKLHHPRIPFLLTIQEGDAESHLVFGKFGLVGLLGRQILLRADYIQAISSYLKDFAIRRGAKSRIEVIPNGVDVDLFATKYTPRELRAVRENLGIKDEYVVVTTSRLVEKNGIDVLIEAIALFKEKRLNVKCVIVGDGPKRHKLKAKSEKLKIANNILFLGQIPQRDLPLYLKIADVFVRPSRSEGLGNSFLEAMAAGVPVIGTRVGGIVDFLQDGVTGLYAKVDDPKDVAEKIQFFIDHPAERKRVVENAEHLIRQNYTWEKIAALFRNIFDRLINSKQW